MLFRTNRKEENLSAILFRGSVKHKILFLIASVFFIINVNAADINAGTNTPDWSSNNVGGVDYTSSDNLFFTSSWNQTYNLTSDVECVNLTIGAGTTINLNGYNLTVTGSLALVNNAARINVGNSRLTIAGDLSMTAYYSNGLFTTSAGLVELGGNFTANNNHDVMAGGVSGFAGTLRITGATAPIITLTNAPIAIGTLDWDCKSPVPLPSGFSTQNTVNADPCIPSLSATILPDFGNVCPGTATEPNSFSISGLGLNSNVTLSSVTGFSYSLTYSGVYTNTLSFPPNKIGHFSTTIFVKFTPPTVGSFSGDIEVSSNGASSIFVTARGNGLNEVAPIVISESASDITSSSATLEGNIVVDGCTSNNVSERGFYYSTINGFADGTGTKISETGTFGTGSYSLPISGLSPNTTYFFKAFATNSNGTNYSAQETFNNIPKTYYSTQSGNWTSKTTWTTEACGSSYNSGTFPQAYDNVVICQQHNISINEEGLSCNNLNMEEYLSRLILNYNFTIYGGLSLANQSYVSVGDHDLTIKGDFTIVPYSNKGWNSRIDYNSGNINISGNISTRHDGLPPFNCIGTGWLILNGNSQTFNVGNENTSVPRLRQPFVSFTKTGNRTLTITNTFDRNCGSAPTVNQGSFSVTGTTINEVCLNTINTGSINGSSFCAGTTGINVPFTYIPTSNFASANFTAQLSDPSGSFENPTSLESISSDGSGSQNILVNIPTSILSGSGYRLRIVSDSPEINGVDNGTNITIHQFNLVVSPPNFSDCPLLDNQTFPPFNPEHGSYNPGASVLSFKIEPDGNSLYTNGWTFKFDLNTIVGDNEGSSTITKLTFYDDNGNEIISHEDNFPESINAQENSFIIIEYQIQNIQGRQQIATFIISDADNGSGCPETIVNYEDDNESTFTILPMPVIGNFD